MPDRFDRIDFYGKGPFANYPDRQSAAMMGRYVQRVEDQFDWSYPRPQECANHGGLRWIKVLDADGLGLEFASKDMFSATALPFSRRAYDLSLGAVSHTADLQREEACGSTFVNLDLCQMGVGYIEGGDLPENLNVLHEAQSGRVRTVIIRGAMDEVETALKSSNPVFFDMIPLTLEEIFIYEMGGAAYEIKDVIL